MAHHPSSLLLLLLLVFLHCMPHVSSEKCYEPICRYTLEVSLQFSHIYDTDDGDYYDVDLEPGTKNLRVVNSTFRPGVDPPIGDIADPRDVITLDGVKRTVFTINGQFPGPTLEFVEGSQVVITVVNGLDDKDVSIHWHGFPQQHNPWFDGVPQLTQCPILPGCFFVYRMNASHAGTFWYHSHIAYQRFDGLSGMIIIHPKSGPSLPYFPVTIQEWYHMSGSELYFSNPRAAPAASGLNQWRNNEDLVDGSAITSVAYISGLINGRGRYDLSEGWPLEKFTVQSSDRYLFHITHTGGQVPLQVSVDSHKLAVVGVDSRAVDPPIFVDSIILYTGERVVFQLEANQAVGRYWFRSRFANDETVTGFFRETLAILEYEGVGTDDEPTTITKACTASDHCTVFNCPFKYYPPSFFSDCVHMADAKRTYTLEERYKYGLNKLVPDEEHFVNIRSARGPKFNAKGFLHPTSPVYQTDSETVSCADCPDAKVCECTHIIDLAYNKVVQFVISNLPTRGGDTHPIHFHGHDYAVVHQGFGDYEYRGVRNNTEDIECNNDLCNRARWARGVPPTLNLNNPPLKDTVVVPISGYAVIRFRSDNPGPWLVHCHMGNHIVQGNIVFLIMEARERFPPIPVRNPTCAKNYNLTDYEYEKYLYTARKSLITGKGFQKVSPHFTIPETPPPRPPPTHPRPTFPPHNENEGKIIMSVGGVVGMVMAAFLGGFLINLIIVLICKCCCHCRRPMDQQRRHLGKNAVVFPSPPTYIGSGPVATYGAPIKPISYY